MNKNMNHWTDKNSSTIELREYLITPLDRFRKAEVVPDRMREFRVPLTETMDSVMSNFDTLEKDPNVTRTLAYRFVVKAITHILKV